MSGKSAKFGAPAKQPCQTDKAAVGFQKQKNAPIPHAAIPDDFQHFRNPAGRRALSTSSAPTQITESPRKHRNPGK